MTDAPPNGAVRSLQLVALIGAFAGCILVMGAIAGLCIFYPPQDWNLVNTVTSNLNALALLLAGGLLGVTKPGGSAP
jgi:hypothetical protein